MSNENVTQNKSSNWQILNTEYQKDNTPISDRLTYEQFEKGWQLAHSRRDVHISKEEIKKIKNS